MMNSTFSKTIVVQDGHLAFDAKAMSTVASKITHE